VDTNEPAATTPIIQPSASSPNQINNVLAFPGVFRGSLDVRAHSARPRT
jgi:malic enzyme